MSLAAYLITTIIKVLMVFVGILLTMIYMTWVERRVCAFIQSRIGPNRVGPQGLLQPIADGLKLLMKEDIIPAQAHKAIFVIAPFIALFPALITFAVIPFGNKITIAGQEIELSIADINVAILYVFSITSLGVFGIALAGWSANNKYSFLGGLRSAAQMISYEISMGLSVIGVIMISESLRLHAVVEYQTGWHWNILLQPIGFIIFLVSSFAETNRLPFDLPEAEPELVAGYHTEYSGMKFSLFYMAEYINMVTASAMVVTLFLGGWQVPYLSAFGLPPLLQNLIEVFAFVLKTAFFLFLFVWVRWTIPRFRYDQLMGLGWRVFLPIALLNIMVTGVFIILGIL